MADDDQIRVQRIDDRHLGGLGPVDRPKLPVDAHIGAEVAEPLAHLRRRALAGVVEPPLVRHDAGDRLFAAGVGHRRMRDHAVEHDVGADQLRAVPLRQRRRLDGAPFARGTGVEEDGNRLRIDWHFLPPCLRPPEREGVSQSNASWAQCAPK
ncbi:MAG: hypothetical protein WDM85_03955 [Caulobacteraceae bacterium]